MEIEVYAGDLCWKVRNIFRKKNQKKNIKYNGTVALMGDNGESFDDLPDYHANQVPNFDDNVDDTQYFDTENYFDGDFDDDDIMPTVTSHNDKTRKPTCKISRRDTLLSYYGTIFGKYYVCW